MPHRRSMPCLATAILLLVLQLEASPVAAQAAGTPPGDTLLVTRPLRGPADTLKVRLEKGGQYRVMLWPAAAQLQAMTLDGHASAFAARTREGAGGGPTLVELYPPQSADYSIIITSAPGSPNAHVELWADRKLAAAHQEQRDRAWGIGLSIAGELYSAYSTIEGSPEEGGTGIGGCLLVGSSGPFSACLGFDTQARSGEAGSLTWYFLEPRYRLLMAHALGRPFDLLVTLRIGQGHQELLSVDPSLVAPGVMLAYHLDDRPGARGWRLTVQAYGALIGNTNQAQKPTFLSGALGLSWIP
ncbi:MAG: hypothetical protein OSW71_02910 [Proteobacteria bacterium]|nr:hypothetical protein [Pseudomonadota bacterium]